MPDITIKQAEAEELPAISILLHANKLPAEDLEPGRQLFWTAKEAGLLAGVIGLEIYGQYGLLRSLATHENYRNRGIAALLIARLFEYAKEKDIKDIYLLTETAEQYFTGKGFSVVSRDLVPGEIKSSKEFNHICPSSALVMKRPVLKKKLLFVCVENSNRSQMSQAFATLLGGSNVEAYSAGSKPSGIVNPKAVAAMRELGYDLSRHDSKSLDEVKKFAPFDAVITMGCGDACPWMPAKQFIDWQIPDPRNMEKEQFNEVRDLIRDKVKSLLGSLG